MALVAPALVKLGFQGRPSQRGTSLGGPFDRSAYAAEEGPPAEDQRDLSLRRLAERFQGRAGPGKSTSLRSTSLTVRDVYFDVPGPPL